MLYYDYDNEIAILSCDEFRSSDMVYVNRMCSNAYEFHESNEKDIILNVFVRPTCMSNIQSCT